MAKSVALPSRTFPTRKAAKDFCREVHNIKYAPGEVVSNSGEVAVLRDLVALHPRADEKIGPGIAEFFIAYTSQGDREHVRHGQTGIWIRDVDGNVRDFSYNTAIDEPTDQAIVKEALRNEVIDLRETLRESAFAGGRVSCPRSGLAMDHWDQAAVVYEDPTWGELTAAFAASAGGWGSLETNTGDGSVQIGRRLRDRALAEQWRIFWRANAHPVIVSKDAVK